MQLCHRCYRLFPHFLGRKSPWPLTPSRGEFPRLIPPLPDVSLGGHGLPSCRALAQSSAGVIKVELGVGLIRCLSSHCQRHGPAPWPLAGALAWARMRMCLDVPHLRPVDLTQGHHTCKWLALLTTDVHPPHPTQYPLTRVIKLEPRHKSAHKSTASGRVAFKIVVLRSRI